jgi:hypothetical protein
VLHSSCITSDDPVKHQMIMDFCKRKESYSLRERISREFPFIKDLLDRQTKQPKQGFESGLELINIFIKRNPNYLVQYNNF